LSESVAGKNKPLILFKIIGRQAGKSQGLIGLFRHLLRFGVSGKAYLANFSVMYSPWTGSKKRLARLRPCRRRRCR